MRASDGVGVCLRRARLAVVDVGGWCVSPCFVARRRMGGVWHNSGEVSGAPLFVSLPEPYKTGKERLRANSIVVDTSDYDLYFFMSRLYSHVEIMEHFAKMVKIIITRT